MIIENKTIRKIRTQVKTHRKYKHTENKIIQKIKPYGI